MERFQLPRLPAQAVHHLRPLLVVEVQAGQLLGAGHGGRRDLGAVGEAGPQHSGEEGGAEAEAAAERHEGAAVGERRGHWAGGTGGGSGAGAGG